MGKWISQLSAKTEQEPKEGHCQNRQKALLSPLAVTHLGGIREFAQESVEGRRQYQLTAAEADRAHLVPWTDADAARFTARVALFIRRGVPAADADDLAERLHLRDLELDDRRLCLECRRLAGHARNPWRCIAPDLASVATPLPTTLAESLQRCPAFESSI